MSFHWKAFTNLKFSRYILSWCTPLIPHPALKLAHSLTFAARRKRTSRMRRSKHPLDAWCMLWRERGTDAKEPGRLTHRPHPPHFSPRLCNTPILRFVCLSTFVPAQTASTSAVPLFALSVFHNFTHSHFPCFCEYFPSAAINLVLSSPIIMSRMPPPFHGTARPSVESALMERIVLGADLGLNTFETPSKHAPIGEFIVAKPTKRSRTKRKEDAASVSTKPFAEDSEVSLDAEARETVDLSLLDRCSTSSESQGICSICEEEIKDGLVGS